MRTVLSKILLHFDVSLQPESDKWDNARSFVVWEKGPLFVRLSDVKSESSI